MAYDGIIDLTRMCYDNFGFISENKLILNAYHPSYFSIGAEEYTDKIVQACKAWAAR
jgi:hypothetical protein